MRVSAFTVGFRLVVAVLALAFVGEAFSWFSWARVAATSALKSSTASCNNADVSAQKCQAASLPGVTATGLHVVARTLPRLAHKQESCMRM